MCQRLNVVLIPFISELKIVPTWCGCQEEGTGSISYSNFVSFIVTVVAFTTFSLVHDSQALNFIKQLGEAMHSVNSGPNPSQHLQLILVISPVRSEKLSGYDFGPGDLKQLAGSVDGFSLMTYDFSGPQKPGPNAPLEWIKYCLGVLLGDDGAEHAHMIFLGINFYGNDFVIAEGESICLDLDYVYW